MSKTKVFLNFFLILIVIATLSAADIRNESSGDKDVQELIESWVAMWNSYDLTMADKLFLQDSRVSYFSSEREGLIQGIESVREHHLGFGFVEGGKSQENKLWIEDVQTSVFGTAAVVAGIWYFQRGSDDPENVQKGPFTFVCVRQGEEWRLAHVNFSEYKE
jgi:ketosteroid isomerase-like protein